MGSHRVGHDRSDLAAAAIPQDHFNTSKGEKNLLALYLQGFHFLSQRVEGKIKQSKNKNNTHFLMHVRWALVIH